MLRTVISLQLTLCSTFTVPVTVWPQRLMSKVAMNGGKGFGGGEATRDPSPTLVDPNDPKGKQQAIHKAESFAEYLAKRAGGGVAAAPVAVAAPPAASYVAPTSEAAAKAAWLAKQDAPTWGSSAQSYPNLPPSVKPGVVTGQALLDLLEDAKQKGYAIPAVNCVTSSSVNACLEAAAKADAPIMIQFSSGGSQVPSPTCTACTVVRTLTRLLRMHFTDCVCSFMLVRAWTTQGTQRRSRALSRELTMCASWLLRYVHAHVHVHMHVHMHE
jgi:hypothetical protein